MQIKTVMIVTNIPNPYRIPLFNELNEQLRLLDMELRVVFACLSYSRRKFNLDMGKCSFKYDVLASHMFRLGSSEKVLFTYKGLLDLVEKVQPDKIIISGFSIGTIKLWMRSLTKRTKYIIWAGSTLANQETRSWLRKAQRKVLLKQAKGVIAYGSQSRDYFLSMGVPESKINIAINTVDTKYFAEETAKIRKAGVAPDERSHITYIGYLVPRKNLYRILAVVKQLLHSRENFVLDIIGDGEDRENLKNFVMQNNLAGHVTFHGFKQKEELPHILATSKCFLFQTDFDIWGQVLVEAMAAGVPCISSVWAGATYDLIQEGVTGFAMDFGDTEKVADKVKWILDNEEEAKRIGENASVFVAENASIRNSVSGFLEALLME